MSTLKACLLLVALTIAAAVLLAFDLACDYFGRPTVRFWVGYLSLVGAYFAALLTGHYWLAVLFGVPAVSFCFIVLWVFATVPAEAYPLPVAPTVSGPVMLDSDNFFPME